MRERPHPERNDVKGNVVSGVECVGGVTVERKSGYPFFPIVGSLCCRRIADQSKRGGRELLQHLISHLHRCTFRGVFGQTSTGGNRKADNRVGTTT